MLPIVRPFAVVAVLVCAQGVFAQADPAASQWLNDATQAMNKVGTVEFKSRRFATGPLAAFIDVEGSVRLDRSAKDKTRMTGLLSGTGKGLRAAPDGKFNVLITPGKVTWVNDGLKTVFERPLEVGSESMQVSQESMQLVLDEWFSSAPFEREFKAEKLELGDVREIRGVKVQTVRATFRNGEAYSVWGFGVDDKLPRMKEIGTEKDPNQKVAMIVEMGDLKTNHLAAGDFSIPTPDGYKRDVQAASAAPVANPVDPNAQQNAVPAGPPPVLGVEPGNQAPSFSLSDTGGSTVSLESLKGNVVVLAFWTRTNTQATRSLPVVQSVVEKFAGKPVKAIAAAAREKEAAPVADFLKQNNLTLTAVINADDTAKAYKVRGYPSFAVIGADGKMVEFIQGNPGDEALRTRLNTAVERALEAGKK